MTQDAVLTDPDAIVHLLRAFDDPSVAAAYGRQLPRPEAEAIEAHARIFNYPESPQKRDISRRSDLGFKTIFISNSFAAYRRSVLTAVGGFPIDVIFGEDTITAAKLLMAGWKIEYVPQARVFHSHSYSLAQEFKRYFDIGVLHSRESWLVKSFGAATGEGSKFLRSEITYLMNREMARIPASLIRSALKLAGYRLGLIESHIPPPIKSRLSMHHAFWSQPKRIFENKGVLL
jgi:rhamnosyltransferase